MELTYNNLKKYKYATQYQTDFKIQDSLVMEMLQKAWETTPSKNNIMPYKIHVIGPEKQNLKDMIYLKCLNKEAVNDNISPEIRYGSAYFPNFYNIVSCSHLLIFTLRIETIFNDWQQSRPHLMRDSKNIESSSTNAKIEVGMFCAALAAMCFENNIDIGHTACVPKEASRWPEPEFSFIDNEIILLMTIGKGSIYRQTKIGPKIDPKPAFERIVNFI